MNLNGGYTILNMEKFGKITVETDVSNSLFSELVKNAVKHRKPVIIQDLTIEDDDTVFIKSVFADTNVDDDYIYLIFETSKKYMLKLDISTNKFQIIEIETGGGESSTIFIDLNNDTFMLNQTYNISEDIYNQIKTAILARNKTIVLTNFNLQIGSTTDIVKQEYVMLINSYQEDDVFFKGSFMPSSQDTVVFDVSFIPPPQPQITFANN